jgi:hypothetical protein
VVIVVVDRTSAFVVADYQHQFDFNTSTYTGEIPTIIGSRGSIVTTINNRCKCLMHVIDVTKHPEVKKIGLLNAQSLGTMYAAMCDYIKSSSSVRRLRNTTSLITAFVTSRPDYCNSMLSGLPKSRQQNATARLEMGMCQRDYVIPALQKLTHTIP